MPDLLDIFALHPLPWRITEALYFGECLPLTILDADGGTVCAISGHGRPDKPATANDWLVARAFVAAMREEYNLATDARMEAIIAEANTKTVGQYKSALHTFSLDPLIEALDGLKRRMGELKTVVEHERAHEEHARTTSLPHMPDGWHSEDVPTFIRCHNCPAPHVCTDHDKCLL
jgi:hypothetical protein